VILLHGGLVCCEKLKVRNLQIEARGPIKLLRLKRNQNSALMIDIDSLEIPTVASCVKRSQDEPFIPKFPTAFLHSSKTDIDRMFCRSPGIEKQRKIVTTTVMV
jgi:hypothetical protein